MLNEELRKVCVFTGSRADYGPSKPLIRRLHNDTDIDCRILVSGGHLVPSQGFTVQAIEADNFQIDEQVDMVLENDSPTAISKSFGVACIGYADAMRRLDPDIFIVIGDRYEALAAAIVAMQHGSVIAHFGGGQLSYGSIDNQMRHAISKLSHLHFTVDSSDTRRLIEMGENVDRITEVGMIGIDSTTYDQLLDKDTLSSSIGIEIEYPTFIVTLHPATSDRAGSVDAIHGLIAALERFPEAKIVFTSPNVDSGSREIADQLARYAAARKHNSVYVTSLGESRYLSLVKHADVVIGNSSSGIIEAPILGTPTVNIGSRQEGRVRYPSVIDSDESTDGIYSAISRCLAMNTRQHSVRQSLASVDSALDSMVKMIKHSDLSALRRKV